MKRSSFLVVLLLLAVVLTACGGGKNSEEKIGNTESGQVNTPEQEPAFHMQEQLLPDPAEGIQPFLKEGDGSEECYVGFDGETIYRISYYLSEGYIYAGYLIQTLKPPYTEWNTDYIPYWENWGDELLGAKAFSEPKDGRIYWLLSQGIDTEQKYIGCWHEDGTREMVGPVESPEADEAYFHGKKWKADKEGNFYLFRDRTVTVWNQDFSESRELILGGQIWDIFQVPDNGRILWYGEKGNKAGIRDAENQEILIEEDSERKVPRFGKAHLESEERFCLTDGGSILRKDEDGEHIFDMFETGWRPEEVYDLTMDVSGTILLLVRNEGELSLWKQMKGAEQSADGKKELTLVTTVVDSCTRNAVAYYNRTSTEYQIKLITPDENQPYREFDEGVMFDIASGNGPDMIVGYVLNQEERESLIEKGFFLELDDWFAEEKPNLYDKALEACTVNGKLYGIPYRFVIMALATSDQIADAITECRVEELMEAVENSEAEVLLAGYDGPSLTNKLLFSGEVSPELIDLEKRESHFDGELFVRVLEFAEKYRDPGSEKEKGDRVAAGEVAAYEAYLYSPDCMLLVENMFHGETNFIGYPSENGGGDLIMTEEIYVNAGSEGLEGIREFLTMLMSEERQDKIMGTIWADNSEGYYPVRLTSLDKLLEKYMTEKRGNTKKTMMDGISYENRVLTGEEINSFREIMKTARPWESRYDVFKQIISEETPAYFNGDKSAEEVARIVQNRAQLYLDEK